MRQVSLLFSLMLAGAMMVQSQAAHAQAAPVATDSRVKTFVYNENDVYNLLTYYGFQSNVEFGPKEMIETVSIGDRAGWQVVPAGRRLFVRAVANELHTNMTVVTNLRAYQFDLRATDPATVPQEELVYVIRFFYPDDAGRLPRPGAALVPAAPAPAAYPMPAPQPAAYGTSAPISSAPLAPPPAAVPYPTPTAAPAPIAAPAPVAPASLGTLKVPTQNRYGAGPFDTPVAPGAAALQAPVAAAPAASSTATNYNYTYTGESKLLPYAMFDDGKRTYFQFAQDQAVPKIRAYDAAGKSKSVKLTKEGDYRVAAMVANRFELTGKAGKAAIYNETRQ